jgi:hypothetical protein
MKRKKKQLIGFFIHLYLNTTQVYLFFCEIPHQKLIFFLLDRWLLCLRKALHTKLLKDKNFNFIL